MDAESTALLCREVKSSLSVEKVRFHKRVIWISAFTAFILFMGLASAFTILKVSPSRISPNQIVTITYTSQGESMIDRIEVTAPDGTLYVKDYDPDIYLSDGESRVEKFGTGVAGWSPEASTALEGWYKVVVICRDPPYNAEDYFDVSRQFYVPEFTAVAVALAALGFGVYAVLRRFKGPT